MIHLDYSSSNPIYLQIKENIKKLILSGSLKENESLPSVRTLASGLAINVNTVIRAYRELESEGFIYSVAGKGSFVSEKRDVIEGRKSELLHKFDEIVTELKGYGMETDELSKRIKEGGNGK